MATRHRVEKLTRAEESAYRAYQEANLRANSARKELALNQLKERGIKLNKTCVYVTNFNGEEARVIVRDVTKSGKVTCFPCDEAGNQTDSRQAACCPVDQLRFSSADQRKVLAIIEKAE